MLPRYYKEYQKRLEDIKNSISNEGLTSLTTFGFDVLNSSNPDIKNCVAFRILQREHTHNVPFKNSLYSEKSLPTFLQRGCIDPMGWPVFLTYITSEFYPGSDTWLYSHHNLIILRESSSNDKLVYVFGNSKMIIIPRSELWHFRRVLCRIKDGRRFVLSESIIVEFYARLNEIGGKL